jgi:hypothetical protein
MPRPYRGTVRGRCAEAMTTANHGAVQDCLPRIAASRKRCWRFSAVVAGAVKGGRRIDNPPQVNNLPHNSSRRSEVQWLAPFSYFPPNTPASRKTSGAFQLMATSLAA